MGSIRLKPKAIKVVCNNCFRITTGYRDENGVVKYQCTRCGATSVSKVMGRRHVQLDVYAPAGQDDFVSAITYTFACITRSRVALLIAGNRVCGIAPD